VTEEREFGRTLELVKMYQDAFKHMMTFCSGALGNGCVVFPRLLGWVSTIVNGPTQHRRGRLDTAFSYKKAYETILTLTLTKQALRK
jgi:hypothetical protein